MVFLPFLQGLWWVHPDSLFPLHCHIPWGHRHRSFSAGLTLSLSRVRPFGSANTVSWDVCSQCWGAEPSISFWG